MAYQQATPTGGALPTTGGTHEERKLARDVNEEYHDPLDDWSSRDILLSLVPYIVVFAFKDAALYGALSFGIAWAGFLLLMRLIMYDGRHKQIWPILEMTTIIAFAILRGFMRPWDYWMVKWMPVMLPLIFATVAILTILWRRPFVGHYARYPKFDRGGKGVWRNDSSYRRTADLATLGWISAWSVSLLLSLIPILTGYWHTWHALNVIFNYIIPFVLIALALIFHQLMGAWYRSKASKSAAITEPERGAAYPTGATPEGATAPPGTTAPGGTYV